MRTPIHVLFQISGKSAAGKCPKRRVVSLTKKFLFFSPQSRGRWTEGAEIFQASVPTESTFPCKISSGSGELCRNYVRKSSTVVLVWDLIQRQHISSAYTNFDCFLPRDSYAKRGLDDRNSVHPSVCQTRAL